MTNNKQLSTKRSIVIWRGLELFVGVELEVSGVKQMETNNISDEEIFSNIANLWILSWKIDDNQMTSDSLFF